VQWCAPVIKLLALSWVSCIVLGFLSGDVALLFVLLVLAAATDLLLVFCSANPRVRQNGPGEALCLLGWAVPLALVLAGAALRTGEVGLSGLIKWQVSNGVAVASSTGGALAQAGSACGVAAAIVCALGMARIRPLGRGLFDEPPGGVTADLSGPPLALLRLSETAGLVVVPLVLVLLFFAGPHSQWYEIAFWGLKVLGLIILLGVVDLVLPRARSDRAFVWSLAAGGLLALAGVILVWVGVSM
jgi:NADH:ubiquinone oxidoreductase subunit H